MAGRLKLVRAYRGPQTPGDSDGFKEPLTPSTWWATFEPLDPIASDGTRIVATRLRGRYHPEITVDSILVYGERELFVKGVQNVDDANRHLVLYCEEVTA